MPGAVQPFERLRARLRPARLEGVPPGPNGPLITQRRLPSNGERPDQPTWFFPKWQRELFKTILEEEGLRFDREGRPRTSDSLCHTYICLRLMVRQFLAI